MYDNRVLLVRPHPRSVAFLFFELPIYDTLRGHCEHLFEMPPAGPRPGFVKKALSIFFDGVTGFLVTRTKRLVFIRLGNWYSVGGAQVALLRKVLVFTSHKTTEFFL